MISGDEVLELLPALADRSPTGGYLFYDCQTDDARLVLTVLAEAERFGAVAANRVEALGLLEERRARASARACATASPARSWRSGPTNVVNATGVWADRLRPAELHDEAEVPVIRPSRGTHLVVDARRAAAGRGRDRARRRGPDDLRAAVARADAGRHHRQRLRRRDSSTSGPPKPRSRTCSTRSTRSSRPRWTPGDVAGAYAGVRPLISTGDPRKSVDISRKAELYETSSGMVTITGGKLTTWRRMAKVTVDRIV